MTRYERSLPTAEILNEPLPITPAMRRARVLADAWPMIRLALFFAIAGVVYVLL